MSHKNDIEVSMGNILRALRIAQDISVKELSEKMGISATYICDVEANRKHPSVETLEKYSAALGVKVSTLFYFKERRSSERYDFQQLLFDILCILLKKRKSVEFSENWLHND